MIRLLAGVLLAALAPAALAAQPGWVLDLSAGRALYTPVAAQDQIGVNNLMLGVRYEGNLPGWFYLSGGVPLAAEDPRWGAGGVGGRLSVGGDALSAGLHLGSHLYGYTDAVAGTSGAGGTVELLPGISARWGEVGVEVHSGLVQHTAALPQETLTRRVHDTVGRVVFAPLPPLQIMAEGRYVRAPEGSYPFAGGTAEFTHARGSVWALGGRWLDEDIPTPVYGAGTSLRLTPRLALHAAWQQEASDPLYWNSPRRSWTLRVSHRLGSRNAPAVPLPPRTPDGQVILRIPLEEARTTPYVLGDFTGWQPVPMVRSGRYWTVALPIAPGVYRYAFRTEDGTWFIPASVPGQADDGMGGRSAVLIVP